MLTFNENDDLFHRFCHEIGLGDLVLGSAEGIRQAIWAAVFVFSFYIIFVDEC